MVTLEDRRTVRELDDVMRSAKSALDRELHYGRFNMHAVVNDICPFGRYHAAVVLDRHAGCRSHEILTAQLYGLKVATSGFKLQDR